MEVELIKRKYRRSARFYDLAALPRRCLRTGSPCELLVSLSSRMSTTASAIGRATSCPSSPFLVPARRYQPSTAGWSATTLISETTARTSSSVDHPFSPIIRNDTAP